MPKAHATPRHVLPISVRMVSNSIPFSASPPPFFVFRDHEPYQTAVIISQQVVLLLFLPSSPPTLQFILHNVASVIF